MSNLVKGIGHDNLDQHPLIRPMIVRVYSFLHQHNIIPNFPFSDKVALAGGKSDLEAVFGSWLQ